MKLKDWLLNKFLSWLCYTDSFVWFCREITAHINFRFKDYPTFPMRDFFPIVRNIREDLKVNPNSIYAFTLCDTKSFAAIFIRFFVKTKYSHAGFIIPDTMEVVHMKGKGITRQHLLEVLKETDNFSVVAFDVPPENIKEVYTRIYHVEKVKAAYDFHQEMDKTYKDETGKLKRILLLYCSEFIYYGLKGLTNNPLIKPVWDLARNTFPPDAVRDASNRVIYERVID